VGNDCVWGCVGGGGRWEEATERQDFAFSFH